jgi:hypothetical protein
MERNFASHSRGVDFEPASEKQIIKREVAARIQKRDDIGSSIVVGDEGGEIS